VSQKYDSLGDKILGGKQMNIGMSTGGNTGGISGLASKQLVLVGAGALSLSQSLVAGYGTVSFSVPTQSHQTLGLYAGSQTIGQSSSSTVDARSLTFVGAGNVSVGLSNGSLMISGATGGVLTFFASSNTTGESSSSSFDQASINIRGAGIASVGYSGGELIISVPAGGGVGDGGNVLAAGTQTATTLGTVLFADSNGISFGMSGSTRITASYTVPSEISAFAVGNTTQSSSGTIPFANWSVRGEGNVSVGVSNGSLVISGAGGGGAGMSAGLTNAGNTAGNTGTVTGQMVLVGGNNVTLSGSTNGGSITVTVSGPDTQNWFSQAGVSNLGNTAGDTGMVGSRLVLAGAGAVSLSQSTAAGGLGTVSISVTIPNQSALTFFATGNTTVNSSGTAALSSLLMRGYGIVSLGTSNGSILISTPDAVDYTYLSVGNSNLGNTQGDTGVVTGRMVLVGTDMVSLSGSTNAGSMTLSIRATQSNQTVGLYASSQTTGQSSSSTVDARSLTVVGQGGISVGMSGGSLLLSGATGGENFSGGISNLGNTAGDTGVVSNLLVLAGVGAATLSGSTNAGSATVSISVPSQSVQTVGVYASSNTTGESSSSTFDARTMSFRGAGVASVGMSDGEILISVPPGGGGDGYNLIAAGTQTATSAGTVLFANSNGITFGMDGSTRVTASHNGLTTQFGQAFSAPGGSSSFQTLVFANSNGVSWSNSNGSVVASVETDYAATNHSHGNPTLALTNLSGTTASNSNGLTLSLSAADPGSAGSLTFFATGNTTVNSSGTAALSSLLMRGYGVVSLGTSNGSILISSPDAADFTFLSVGNSNLGNTQGDTGVVTGRMVLVGTDMVSLSGSTDAGSITLSIRATQSNQTVGLYASSQTTGQSSSSTADARSLTFVGAGGVSVGLSNGRYIISGGAFTAGISGGNTVGDTGTVTGQVVFAGGANITLSGSNDGASQTISIIGGAGGAGYSAGVSSFGNTAGETGLTGTNLVFVGSGPVSLSQTTGANGGTITINAPAVSSLSASGIVSIETNGSTVSIGAPAFSAGMSTQGNTAGNTGLASQRIVFVGSSNITLSGSTDGGSMTISISGGAGGNTGYISAGTATASLGTVVFSNSNGVSFGVDGQTVTASIATSLTNINVSAGTASQNLSAIEFVNSNGISFGLDAGTITASHNGLTSQSNQAVSGSNGSATFETVSFGNSNGMSFYLTNGSVVGSYTVPTQSAQTVGLYASSQTTGQSSSSTADARSITFVGQGIVSVGLSQGSYLVSATQSGQAASGQNGSFEFQTLSFSNANNVSFGTSAGSAITASIPAGATATGNVGAISAAGDSASSGTIVFSNSNNVSFGMNGNTLTATVTVPAQSVQTLGLYASSQTTGQSSSSTFDARSITFVGAGNVSVGMSNSSYIISGSGGETRLTAYATGNTTQSSTGTQALSSILFRGEGVASVGVTNGSVVISVPAGGGGGFTGGMSTQGNTAGTTGLVSNQLVFVGTGPVSLSQSVNGASATLSIDGPAVSSLSATGGLSISTNGSTISIGFAPRTATMWDPLNQAVKVAGQVGNASLHIVPLPTAADAALGEFQVNRLCIPLYVSNASNSTGTLTISHSFGLYTKTGSSLSLFASTSYSTAWTFSGTESASLHHGIRLHTIPWTTTISDGMYYVAQWSRSSSGGANGSISQILVSQIASNFSGIFGEATNRSRQWPLGFGVFSASVTTAMPSSIAFSQIDGTASVAARPPSFFMISGTA
jgi:hypothetical protein